MVRLERVRKRYELSEERHIEALNIDRLSIDESARICIRGPSGSGKTTVLNVIAGLLAPDEGVVEVDGVAIFKLSESQRDRFRSERIGYLSQTFNLLDPFTALDNVMLGAMFGSSLSRGKRRERSLDWLCRLGLGGRVHHYPYQLSTGEQQRVAAARALVNGPPLLLADEPTANLDMKTSEALVEDLVRIQEAEGMTIIIASHDPVVLKRTRCVDISSFNRPGEIA